VSELYVVYLCMYLNYFEDVFFSPTRELLRTAGIEEELRCVREEIKSTA